MLRLKRRKWSKWKSLIDLREPKAAETNSFRGTKDPDSSSVSAGGDEMKTLGLLSASQMSRCFASLGQKAAPVLAVMAVNT